MFDYVGGKNYECAFKSGPNWKDLLAKAFKPTSPQEISHLVDQYIMLYLLTSIWWLLLTDRDI